MTVFLAPESTSNRSTTREEALFSSMRHTNSLRGKTTVEARSLTFYWRKWKTMSAKSSSSSPATASIWRNSLSTILVSIAELQFADYTDSEFQQILQKLIEKKYRGNMRVEDDIDGLFLRIAPDDFYLTKEDLTGQDPSKAIIDCGAWKKLQEQIGLEPAKGSIRILIERINTNHLRELEEKLLVEVSLNRLLSNGEVVAKNPVDFVGGVLGESESNTKAILAATVVKDSKPLTTDVAMDVPGRARRRPNVGNGGEVENLLNTAKFHQQARQSSKPASECLADIIFESGDFDPDFSRGESAVLNCRRLFEDVVGCDEIVAKLESYQQIAQSMKARGVDPNRKIPTNFVFKGPPGTGKTTTARKMGRIFYDMGFLSPADVLECSASDLVGQYVGHTGPKTQKQLEKGLGRVLFVDEAYRLGEGHFATEAVNQLVDLLTKPKFIGKIVVILAGYGNDMNKLLAVNAGLSSRFPEEVVFQDMSPKHCLRLLGRELEKEDTAAAALQDPATELQRQKDLADALAASLVAEAEALALAEAKATADAADAELKRKLEEARIRELLARQARDRARAAAEKGERRRQEEVRVQTKLRDMGVCPAGYQWIKQAGGYRCAGGSHFVTNGQLGV
ncbi:MAG: hypothetical protein M1839_002170 [Geoglossum umbratile]|nr:MAG: hypothetical protein M1839_002170 [Geoglossum umbratile]